MLISRRFNLNHPNRSSRLRCQVNGRELFSASKQDETPRRREVLAGILLSTQLLGQDEAQAIQGLTAGRIPGLASEPDANGYLQYLRPEGKSGGHGVGWSEIPQYGFKVPQGFGWAEIPVSIADLGGAEIDLRYSSKEQGEIAVVVAPVLRFIDVGFNASVKIEDIGPPRQVIQGFGPELIGKPIDDEDIIDTQVGKVDGLTVYYWQIKPHFLITATATRNRVFILSLRANARQWKKHSEDLLTIQKTFRVSPS